MPRICARGRVGDPVFSVKIEVEYINEDIFGERGDSHHLVQLVCTG
jgi:hypothetical protein